MLSWSLNTHGDDSITDYLKKAPRDGNDGITQTLSVAWTSQLDLPIWFWVSQRDRHLSMTGLSRCVSYLVLLGDCLGSSLARNAREQGGEREYFLYPGEVSLGHEARDQAIAATARLVQAERQQSCHSWVASTHWSTQAHWKCKCSKKVSFQMWLALLIEYRGLTMGVCVIGYA